LDSSFLTALFRDPVLNRLTASKPSGSVGSGARMPESLVAKVTALKGEAAVLRWEGGTFAALLNAETTPGEKLFLKYNGMKEGKPHYRIMARIPGSNTAENNILPNRMEAGESFLFALMPGVAGRQGARPALVRFTPRDEKRKPANNQPEPLIELFLDTERFGLILVRFFYQQGKNIECRFVVESREAGRDLQGEAERFIDETGGSGQAGDTPLKWSVGNLRKKAAEVLHHGGYGINKKA